MPGYTEVFGGQNIYPAQLNLLVLSPMTVDFVLDWPVEQALPGASVFATIIEVDASAGLSITFPDARNAGNGQSVLVNNVGANLVEILDNTGATIGTVASGIVKQFYLRDNTTQAGIWRVFTFGAGTSSADAAALAGAGLKAIGSTLNVKVAPTLTNVTPLAIGIGDRAEVFVWTNGLGAWTLPDPAVVGADWFVYIRNGGTGDLTVTPTAGLINGAADITFGAGDSALIFTDGTNYYTIGFGSVSSGFFDYTSINIAGTGAYVLAGSELNRIAYRLTGVLTGNRQVIVPDTVQQYWVNNATSGAFTVTVKTLTGVGVVVPQGNAMLLYSDGSNVVAAEGASTTGLIPVQLGGTGLDVVNQGDILFGSAPNVYSRLGKATTATRYLANTGATNNPNWDQVNLPTGVTGRLPFANLAQGLALSLLGVAGNAVADEAPIAATAANQVMRNNQFNTGIGWGPIRLDDNTNAVTNVLDETNGGTGLVTYAQGDMLYASGANTLAQLAKDATGLKVLTNQGTSNGPQWNYDRYTAGAAANSAYQFVLTDQWSWIPHTEAATPRAWTIPLNATVAFPVGTMIGIDNRSVSGAVTVTPAGGVTLDGHGATGAVAVAPGFKAIIVKMATDTWLIFTDTPIVAVVGTFYAGNISALAAAAVFSPNAATWVATNPAVGTIRVTHNLALAAVTSLVVTGSPVLAGATDDRFSNIVTLNANFFEIAVVDQGAGAVDNAISFIASRIAA